MKIVIDNKIPLIKGVLEPYGDVLYRPGAAISPNDVRDADALIIRTRTKCDKDLLQNSKVKFIATATIGYDHIDQNFCEHSNIQWTSAPGCNSYSVQQYIASALLSILEENNMDPLNTTLGIVGVGNVGSKVATFAETLGMNVLLNDPPRSETEQNGNFVNIETLKTEADIITFHVPLTCNSKWPTYHLVDDNFLSELSGTSKWIINTSRGEVVDNQAIKNALIKKRITGAVLDVWENEPGIDLEVMKIAKFATPHIAGYSLDGKANGTSMSIQAISRFFELDLDEWYPENIPLPPQTDLTIDCVGKKLQNVIKEAIDATYRISGDDKRLRTSPETFEKQRGDYPLRREPPAFKIKLINDSANFADALKKIRFNII